VVQLKSDKPSETRAPESKHTSAKTSSNSWTSCSSKAQPRADNARPPKRQCRRDDVHIVRTTAIEDVAGNVIAVDLDCAKYPQPCLHYSSVIRHNPAMAYGVNTCPYLKDGGGRGPDLAAKKQWEDDHPKNNWRKSKADGGLIPNRAANVIRGCEADEWPPYALYHEVDGYSRAIDPDFNHRVINKPQVIRYLDGTENGKVGAKWQCKAIAERRSINSNTHETVHDGTTTSYTDWTAVYTRSVYRINPIVVADPDGDDGISANDCYPRGADNDARYQGYALLNSDPFQQAADRARQAGYLANPPANAKRNWLGPDNIVSVGINSSRRLTEEEYEELQHRFGVAACKNGNCNDNDVVEAPVLTSTTLAVEIVQPTGAIPMPQDSAGDAKLPRQTLSI
jgi:chitinase